MSLDNAIVRATAGFGIFGYLTSKLYGSVLDPVYMLNTPVHRPYSPPGRMAPGPTISIVIPAYNEEENIAKTIRSILSQNIVKKYPEYFECIVVDNQSTDRTADIAQKYCQVISAPRGKLNARDVGIRHAVGNIIVSCDADCYYPPNYLNILLRHFYNTQVVAVNGVFLLQGQLTYRIISLWGTLFHNSVKRLWGASSAFRRDAYFKTGGFDLSVNQFDRLSITTEEEVAFYYRLSQVGFIVHDVHAVCFALFRGMGEKVLAEQRSKTTRYTQEVLAGQRF